MRQRQSLGDRRIALRQCLLRKAETEKCNPQLPLRSHLGVAPGLVDKRVVGNWIVKRKPRFQMRSGWSKPAGKHQGSAGGQMTQNEPGGIAALAAQTQQILVQTLRHVEFAAVYVIEKLPKG